MKIEKAIEIEERDFKKRIELRWKKGHDYAKKEGDILSNFKIMAALQRTLEEYGYRIPIEESYGTALWHLFHKLVRILNLINNKTDPKNESLMDTFLDANNYIDLTKECYIDEMKENGKT